LVTNDLVIIFASFLMVKWADTLMQLFDRQGVMAILASFT